MTAPKTDRERAELICANLFGYDISQVPGEILEFNFFDPTEAHLVDEIESALAAVREETIEECAKVADSCPDECMHCLSLSEEIRALGKGEK